MRAGRRRNGEIIDTGIVNSYARPAEHRGSILGTSMLSHARLAKAISARSDSTRFCLIITGSVSNVVVSDCSAYNVLAKSRKKTRQHPFEMQQHQHLRAMKRKSIWVVKGSKTIK